jgi:predicted ABC-type ATPase
MKSKPNKQIEIVAGPNGSGKSTFARAYFRLQNGNSRFINADTIASGLAAGSESTASFHAGRVMLGSIAEALSNEESFAFETTLSGRTWVRILEQARNHGYEITIYFVYLGKVTLNLQRIRQRVKEGGHSIPKETVVRRYPRSFTNFWYVYRPLCQNWFIFDNSKKKPIEIESRKSFEASSSEEQSRFEKIFLKYAGHR